MAVTLRRHHEGLLTIDHPLRAGGLSLGTRTTLLALGPPGERAFLLHGPGPLGPVDHAAIGKLGEVRAIVAPNALHHLFLRDAVRAYPNARVLAAKGALGKVGQLPGAASLGAEPDPVLGADIEHVPILGMPKLDEFAFFHAPSRTLVLTDLVFNMRHSEHLLTRLFMRANGALGRFGTTRLGRAFVESREALRESVRRLLALDVERVVMAHGEVVERGGREALRESFGWLFEGRDAA